MSLVVEDGSCKSNADAYISLEDCDEYHANMGNTAWVVDDEDADNIAARETAIRKGTAFIDRKYNGRFRGRRQGASQALMWPRWDAIDEDGFVIEGVPDAVKYATCEAALRAYQGTDLMPDMERGGQVIQETIGPISTTYAAGAPAGTRYDMIEGLLRPCLSGGGLRLVRA